MIDTAIGDTVSDGLINFDKRRKEFEVLAQVHLQNNPNKLVQWESKYRTSEIQIHLQSDQVTVPI